MQKINYIHLEEQGLVATLGNSRPGKICLVRLEYTAIRATLCCYIYHIHFVDITQRCGRITCPFPIHHFVI